MLERITMKTIALFARIWFACRRVAWARLCCAALGFLLVHSAASATDYTFPGSMPAGCSGSGGSYSCGALTLAYGDTITIASPMPATITINGAFSTNNATINTAGAASDLSIVIGGALTVAYQANLNANVSAASITDSDGQVVFGGNIAATTGDINLKYKTKVAGSVSSTSGLISMADNVKIAGSVTSTSGAVSLTYKGKVGGSISTSGAVTLANECQIGGNISGGSGKVSVGYAALVSGSITTSSGAIQLAQNSVTSACVKSTGSASITLDYQATANSVCCGGSCGTSCVVNNSSYSMPPVCTVVPTCVGDDFSSGAGPLNPALWNASAVAGSFTPSVVAVGSQNRLRLTSAVGNESTMAQIKKLYPGAGNKIVVEFNYYAYGGNGADGVAVVFSDASVSPSPGGFGGSLGYSPHGASGFNGGWLAVGLDEYGNFPNPTEGRSDYPSGWTAPAGANVAAGFAANNVAVRGSGAGTTGYALLANTGTLATPIWSSSNTSSSVQRFRITIDNSDSVQALVKVERDTTGSGSSYATVVPAFNARGTSSGQAAVPANWIVSFTGSTGGSNNNHEMTSLSVCATYVTDPSGSTVASTFDCLETGVNVPWVGSARKPLYTKLANTAFKFDVAALKSDATLESNYVAAGGNTKYLKVELFDDTTPAATCAAYTGAVTSQTLPFSSGSFSGAAGRVLSGDFTVPNAYRKLRCRVKECTDSACASFSTVTPGCSSDQFSVRPSAAVLVTTASAAPASITSTPIVKAGATFTLRATTSAGTNYSGTLTQDTLKFTAQTTTQATTQQSGGVVGTLTPTTLTANAAAVSATYSEVGYLYLAAGAYRDESFTAVDSAVGDCVTSTTSDGNLSDSLSGGKYGCHIGNTTAVSLGRFVPDHFAVSSGTVGAACTVATPFSYFGQDGFTTAFTVTAQQVGTSTTQNYAGVFAKFNTTSYAAYGFTGATLPAGSSLGSSATAPSGSWASGVATVSAKHQVSRPTALAAETSITVSAAPTDGEVPVGASAAVGSATKLRYGRLRLQNIYGSEKLPLAVPVQAQYWGGNSFVVNTDDSCTAVSIPAARTLSGTAAPDGAANLYFYPLVTNKNQLSSTDTAVTMTSVLAAGVTALKFSAPNKAGWVDTIMGAPDYLKSDWGNCSGQTGVAGSQTNLPCARATFGIYKSPLIYRRENY